MKKHILIFLSLSILCLLILNVIAIEHNKKVSTEKLETKEVYFNDDGTTYNLNDKEYVTETYFCNNLDKCIEVG